MTKIFGKTYIPIYLKMRNYIIIIYTQSDEKIPKHLLLQKFVLNGMLIEMIQTYLLSVKNTCKLLAWKPR